MVVPLGNCWLNKFQCGREREDTEGKREERGGRKGEGDIQFEHWAL